MTPDLYLTNTFIWIFTELAYWNNCRWVALSLHSETLLVFYHCQDFYWTYCIWVTRRVSYKKQELLTIREHLSSPLVFGGVRVAHLFSLLCCSIMCLYVLSSVLWCPLRFPPKTIFCSFLPPVVCRMRNVLSTLVVFVCVQWCPTHIVLCFCFVFLRLVAIFSLSSFFDCLFGIF
jgi:hypothetical protein